MPKTTTTPDEVFKKEFLGRYNLKINDEALLVIDLRKANETKEWLLQYMTGLRDLDVSVVVLGTEKTPVAGEAVIVTSNYDDALKAGDLVVEVNADENNLKEIWAAGAVPICEAGSLAEDYNPIKETGNAFIATKSTAWSYFAATVRALETYRFPYDWKHLKSLCQKMV